MAFMLPLGRQQSLAGAVGPAVSSQVSLKRPLHFAEGNGTSAALSFFCDQGSNVRNICSKQKGTRYGRYGFFLDSS